MKKEYRLVVVKIVHTLIWIFFNLVIGWLFFAVITNRINKWLWMGVAAFVLEGIVLLIFRNMCPLTIIARRYSDSAKYNFDIYLPNWLARYNKIIYSCLLAIVFIMLAYRLINKG